MIGALIGVRDVCRLIGLRDGSHLLREFLVLLFGLLTFLHHLAAVGFDLPFVRTEDHRHSTAGHARVRLELSEFLKVGDDATHPFVASLAMGHLPTSELHDDLDLVAFEQELLGLLHADADVVGIDLHRSTKADFLELGDLGLRLVGLVLLGLFVLVSPVVNDSTHWRPAVGCHFHEIKAQVAGLTKRIRRLDDAGLLAVFINQTDRSDPDPLVHAGAGGPHVLAAKSSASNGDGTNPFRRPGMKERNHRTSRAFGAEKS